MFVHNHSVGQMPGVPTLPTQGTQPWQSVAVKVSIYNKPAVPQSTPSNNPFINRPVYQNPPYGIYNPPVDRNPSYGVYNPPVDSKAKSPVIGYPPIDLRGKVAKVEVKVEKDKVNVVKLPARPAVQPKARNYTAQNSSLSPIVAFAIAIMFTGILLSVLLPPLTIILVPSAVVVTTGGVFVKTEFYSRVA